MIGTRAQRFEWQCSSRLVAFFETQIELHERVSWGNDNSQASNRPGIQGVIMIRVILKYVPQLLAVVGLGLATFHLVKAHQPLPDSPPPMPPVQSPFVAAVAGVGLIEPRTESISLGVHVPGVVAAVHVAVGQQVRAGEALFCVDDRNLKAELAVRMSRHRDAMIQLERLQNSPRPEEIPPSEALVREASAALVQAEDLLTRSEVLFGKRVIPEETVVQNRLQTVQARERLRKAEADHKLLLAGAWKEDLNVARSAVEQAAALVEQTQVEIQRLCVTAPRDATVLKVDVRAGEYVSVGQTRALMTLGDVSRLHLRVDIDEQDIPRFRVQAAAEAAARGNADVRLPLEFVRIEPVVIPKRSLTGDSTERTDTRVMQVIYALPERLSSEQQAALLVGQQCDVFVAAG